jgi:hypothetical protein
MKDCKPSDSNLLKPQSQQNKSSDSNLLKPQSQQSKSSDSNLLKVVPYTSSKI